ncbi:MULTISPECIES: GNAT family N-acetyltransferase [Paenibacillus]|nr:MULTISPECIES: GNAT family N-acetyltransferase [Paenibacillus]
MNRMNADIRARLATLTDAEELSRLNQEFNGGDRRPPAQIMKSLNTNNELVAVAEVNGRIVGFGCAQSFDSFCYEEPQGEITELYVEENARRKGAAAAILSCLEDNLRERGVKDIKVLTGKENDAAIRTYEHNRYVIDDELLLKKRIGE